MDRGESVNYIWYKYKQDSIYLTAGPRDLFSPYVEDCLSADRLPHRLVNPNLRFGRIFNSLIKSEQEMNLPLAERQEIENCLYHYLAQLDRKAGIDRRAVEEYLLAKDIEGGCYGKGIAQDFALLSHEHRRVLLRFLRKHHKGKGLNSYFRQAVQGAFAGAAVYYYPDDDKFLVYIPQPEDEEASACMRLLEFFLLGLGAGLRIFWAYHFGIIGKNNTMSIGSIEIY